ncbi:Metallo-dependent phosphatase-like protein [Morchella snyderi]|nr:Metallo-dependent phosphatase-like protein [Morchella snyderi]
MRFTISTAAIAALAVSLLAPLTESSPVNNQPPAHVENLPSATQQQQVIQTNQEPKKLKGRFLHISDVHPDPFYVAGSDTQQRCHRGSGDAATLGAETSDCDTPFTLVNATFKWIEENLKDEVDFVIWTGDSARHDNDANIPRSETQILDLNRRISDSMFAVFGKPDNLGDDDPTNDLIVPIIPTLGNNDIFPHNIMTAGPNRVTREFSDIWRRFIPQDQYHVFDKGAYFWTQVVPGTNGKMGLGSQGGLSVISLNTIYFFGSNAAVDGCDVKGEAGYEQMEWLKVQLALMRDIGMKAILIGHVPPAWTSTKQSWDETCWKKYVLWSKQYRDVIVGSIYGHMNLDHFLLHDSDELQPPHEDEVRRPKKPRKKTKVSCTGHPSCVEEEPEREDEVMQFDEENPTFTASNAETYLHSLREAFSYLPSPINVVGSSADEVEAASRSYSKKIGGKWGERYILSLVGPSVVPNYFPTLRVVEYNITGLGESRNDNELGPGPIEDDVDATTATVTKKKKKEPGSPNGPSRTSPPGPAYSMQPYTWLGYTQYYANMTRINGRQPEEDEAKTHHNNLELRDVEDNEFRYEVEYNTRTDKTYSLKDMTVKNYLKLAQEIVDATLRDSRKKKAGEKVDGTDVEEYEEEEEEEEEVEDVEEEGGDVDASKKKKKNNGNKKKHNHNIKKDKIWHAFVTRAFVSTIKGKEFSESPLIATTTESS